MRKRIVGALMACVVMAAMVIPASAAVTTPSLVYPQQVQYPVENNGLIYKTYTVATAEAVEALAHGDIQYNGRTYHFLDMTVEELTSHDEKEFSKAVTGDSDTKDSAKILATLETEVEETTEDGYTGILKLDTESLTTAATSYGTGSKVKTVTETYPGMSDGDLALIPKVVTSNGSTFKLTNCTWKEDTNYNPYDTDYGTRFTATATYSANVSYQYAKTYSYEVNYIGTVVKDEVTGYTCTLMFAPEEAPPHWYDVFMNKDGSTNGFMVFFTILLLALLIALAIMLVNYVIPSKKGQTVTTVEEIIEQPQNKQ